MKRNSIIAQRQRMVLFELSAQPVQEETEAPEDGNKAKGLMAVNSNVTPFPASQLQTISHRHSQRYFFSFHLAISSAFS